MAQNGATQIRGSNCSNDGLQICALRTPCRKKEKKKKPCDIERNLYLAEWLAGRQWKGIAGWIAKGRWSRSSLVWQCSFFLISLFSHHFPRKWDESLPEGTPLSPVMPVCWYMSKGARSPWSWCPLLANSPDMTAVTLPTVSKIYREV